MIAKLERDDILRFIGAHKEELKMKYGVRKIGLFGSIARGEHGEQSDIDIVVELEKPDLFSLIGIKQFFQDSLGCRINVVRLRDRMNESLRVRIQRDAIYV
jgi:predicted nucleotidyltransferase